MTRGMKRRLWGGRRWRECGDTLVEVVIALAILSVVLTSSMVVAVKALQLGQTANERTTISDEAQQQIEKVRAFRDNHTWDEFLFGSNDGNNYRGVLNGDGSTGCTTSLPNTTSPCLYMAQGSTGPGNMEYLPARGSMSGSVLGSYIETWVHPGPGSPAQYVDITTTYGFKTLGAGADSIGHIKTRFTDLKFAVAPAVPPGPTPTPPVCVNTPKDIVLALDASHSMTNAYPPSTRANELKTVAKNFILASNISNATNHMSIYRFNSGATRLIDYSSSPASLLAAMGGYSAQNVFSTQYTPALNAATNQFVSSRAGTQKVLVFVTDGYLNAPDTDAQAIAVSNAMNAAGVHIYTIGIASPIPSAKSLLQQISSNNTTDYGDAADTVKLSAIFQAIADQSSC